MIRFDPHLSLTVNETADIYVISFPASCPKLRDMGAPRSGTESTVTRPARFSSE
jgi:hypothetical protein